MKFCSVALLLMLIFLTSGISSAQSTPLLHWSEDGKQFSCESGGQTFTVNVETGDKQLVDDGSESTQQFVRLSLPALRSIDGGPSTKIEIQNRTKSPFQIFWVNSAGSQRKYADVQPGKSFFQNTYFGHSWLLKSETGKPLGSFRSRANEVLVVDEELLKSIKVHKRLRRFSGQNRFRYAKPRGVAKLEVREHNLWLGGKQMTTDATKELTFLNVGSGTNWFENPKGPDVRWSPDEKCLVAFQTANVPQRNVEFIESSPSEQLQPITRRFAYTKPGDDLPRKTLRVFSVKDRSELKEVEVSNELFQHPWSLRFVKWTEDSKKFWLLYNQRGHQALRLVEVDATTGKARTLIEETSDAFIHYSNNAKSVFKPLSENEILWASERSGWNHLYRFDADGQLLGALTEGEWNVKKIDWIDYENETIWFYAVGIRKDQDPYHEHFCRVNFDGSQFIVLTEGDGTHSIQFEQDGKYLLDTYSRVDMAPVSELRDATTGKLIVELERGDTKELFGDRPLTTRFSAKGRDGETDIWGIIHWPKDFDPDAKYPVVENIYAGPHDHHVPKSFRSKYYFQHQIADEGMIVVQIDGMGTAWRSKEFHNVCYKNLKDGGFPDRIAWMKAAAEKYPQMDLSRVGIYGGSAGGQNALAALLWHNDFYKVAVADCGCHDNRMDKIWWNEQWMGWPIDESYAANSNMENAHLLKGHLMLIVGELDRNVDPATTTQVVKKLIEADKDFEFVLVPGKGHGAGDSPWAAKKRLKFFKQHLLK
jgi:dipeptidyl aminopeptidase/acylaminoacyl peptidase